MPDPETGSNVATPEAAEAPPSPAPPTPTPPAAPAAPAPPAAPEQPRRWSGWKITSIVFGSLLTLLAVGLLAGGGVVMWADRTQRDAEGYLSESHGYQTSTYALTVEGINLGDTGAPSWALPSKWLGTVRIRVTPVNPSDRVFVGIARTAAQRRYLHGVKHAEITDFGSTQVATTSIGGGPSVPPTRTKIWTVSASGTGPQTVRWQTQTGSWSVVVMNANGSRGVAVAANAGATVPSLIWIASGLLIAGGLVLMLAILFLAIGLRRPKPAPSPTG
jgi:hypothetical protein